ncbi:MAG: 2-C-methyl-D-erythritol 2,4-cyclodiphosphate synthase, partial [bacterium]
ADSRQLLRHVHEKGRELGFAVGNLDCTVQAQRPKLRPYIEEMRKNLSEDLQVSVGQISVKATTTERLGFVGREEGIAAEAVVLLQSVSWKESYGS